MIKAKTGYITVSSALVVGVTFALVKSQLVDLGSMGAVASQGLNRFGGFLKASGVVGIGLTVIFLMVKFNLIKVITIQQGETGLLVRRGKVVLDKTTGLPKLVNPDRYQLHVAVWRHIAIISNRERTVDLGSIPFTVGGESWVQPMSINWIIRGDAESMCKALIKVSDGNRFDEKLGALETMIRKQSITGLKQAFKNAQLGTNGEAPVVNFELAQVELNSRYDKYGCDLVELLDEPLHRFDVPYDGMKLIADSISALSLTVSVQTESDGPAYPRVASA